MAIKLDFFGAAGNVTGSSYLLTVNSLKVLIDCGLYQEHDLKDRNWQEFPLPPSEIDAVFLTHAHLDHCGLLPRLVRDGFNGRIYCTAATADITKIVLADCAKINEEDAELKRIRHEQEGRPDKYPPVPLYTLEDATQVNPLLSPVDYAKPFELTDHITVEFIEVGHILGASAIRFTVKDGRKKRAIVFSGDIGRSNMPILRDPAPIGPADYLIVESTYGNRIHGPQSNIPEELAAVVNRTVRAGGNLIIPSFAIERTQDLLYFLSELLCQDRIPHLRIFVDSPMASKVSQIFGRHPELYDQETRRLQRIFKVNNVTLVKSSTDSKSLNHIRGTCIIIAGAGMCTGGRIKHHLSHNIESPENTILFVGYQAANTLGREILDGAKEVRIHGEIHKVRAYITQINGFSAHADGQEISTWLHTISNKAPRKIFVTHGEPDASAALAERLHKDFGCPTAVPKYLDSVTLD